MGRMTSHIWNGKIKLMCETTSQIKNHESIWIPYPPLTHWPIDTWYMKAPHKSGPMNVDHVPKVFPFVGLPLSHISKFTKEFRITHRPFLLVNSSFWLKNPTNITSGAVDGAPFLPVLVRRFFAPSLVARPLLPTGITNAIWLESKVQLSMERPVQLWVVTGGGDGWWSP